MLPLSRRRIVVVLLVVASALGGHWATAGVAVEEVSIQGTQPVTFEWAPPAGVTDYVFLLELEAGAETRCELGGNTEGRIRHPSGLGVYTHVIVPPEWSSTYSARRGEIVTAHAGPANSAHVLAPVWGDSFGWGTSLSGVVDRGDVISVMRGTFDVTAPDDGTPHVRVACDSPDAALRFFVAPTFAPMVSASASGGAGAHVNHPAVRAGLNVEDHYRIATSSDRVVLHMHEGPWTFGSLDPHREGEVRLVWPSGEEAIPLPDAGGLLLVHRTWSEPGLYEVQLDRFALGHVPWAGLIAGFDLHTEWPEVAQKSDA